MKRKPDPVTEEEMIEMLKIAKKNIRHYTFLFTSKKTGRRIGELVNLLVKDIDFKNKTARFLIEKSGGKKHTVPISKDLVDWLSYFVKKQGLKPKDKLFGWIGYRQLQNIISKYGKLINPDKNISHHSFRHYFITQCRKKGLGWEQIGDLTGHKEPLQIMRTYDDTRAMDHEDRYRPVINSI